MSKTKKVIILIVEGNSEETLLYERLRDLFQEHQIHFKIYHGDIFLNQQGRAKMKAKVGNLINKIVDKQKFKKADILAVLHLTDTDGCFIPNNSIFIEPNQNAKTLYHLDSISVQNLDQKNYIQNRNKIKSENIRIMTFANKVNTALYRLYYFSRNLEHVVFNEPNPDEHGKIENIEEFLDELERPIEEYLSNFVPEFVENDLHEQYKASWELISENNFSLRRSTNIPLLFRLLQEIIGELDNNN